MIRQGVFDLIDALQQVARPDDLFGVVSGLRDHLELEHVCFHGLNRFGEDYGAVTYTDQWHDAYLDKGLSRVDPVISGVFTRHDPFDWKDLDWSHRGSRDFLEEAVANGVGTQGMTLAMRGAGGHIAAFTLNHTSSDERWHATKQRVLPEAVLMAHYLNVRVQELYSTSPDHWQGKALSPREVDALSLLARGMNRPQAADALKISEHTLRTYIEGARLTLSATNTTHAVARAFALGPLPL